MLDEISNAGSDNDHNEYPNLAILHKSSSWWQRIAELWVYEGV